MREVLGTVCLYVSNEIVIKFDYNELISTNFTIYPVYNQYTKSTKKRLLAGQSSAVLAVESAVVKLLYYVS